VCYLTKLFTLLAPRPTHNFLATRH